MNEVKPHLSYKGQINKLRGRGCIIADDSFCESILVNIGYYRLSAYFPFDNYDNQFPLWVISELFTFSTLSYFYNDLTTADKKEFAGNHYKDMISWMRCCTDLRNICAHYGRLYFRIFTAMLSGFKISLFGEIAIHQMY